MSTNLDALNSVQHLVRQREPLAVIGIGCRLPGGIDSPVVFWDALLRGVNAIRDVPDDRWKHARFHDTNPEKSGSIRNAKGGFIDGVDQFDGEFFGYFPAEAQRIDPQQRLLLEVTHEAMEDAGLRRDQLDGSRTAVYIGSFTYDYFGMQAASEQRDEINPYVAMGTSVSALANRISYDFNLHGPSVSVDTACSSSLTAMHLACRSLWSGEAELAIAGGVNLMLRPESSIMLSKAGFLNPDQSCKAFDAAANGYVRGEGAGVAILKPLNKAIADGDAIYACVQATAANQDGRSPEGFTVPNFRAQSELLKAAYAEAGIDPLTVDFVEAHGTGTRVGDPIETLALGSVLGAGRGQEQANLLIGSVKTNLGHLEGAAGIAGFIKGVLTAHHGVVPPNLHFNEPNPGILLEERGLEVPIKPTPLKHSDRPLTVGVNSFGAGGANAHVVLQALDEDHGEKPSVTNGHRSTGAKLYMLSSAHRDSLRTLALRHAEFLNASSEPFDDIAYSAFTRRSRYSHLLAIVEESASDVERSLRKFAEGEVDPTILTATIARRTEPKLAFVFSGQGGQWARMGLQLMQREQVFRQSMEEIDELFEQLAGWSLLAELQKDDGESRVNDTIVVQPAVMAVQISLVKLYEHYGIRPAGIVGHSIGEVAAGYAAGVLTLEQAVQVICRRSQAQDMASGKGGMLAVGLSLEEASKMIEGIDGVSIGAVNGPEMMTLSGDVAPLQHIAETLESRGIFNRPVRVQVAYHSHHIDAIRDVMLESLSDVQGIQATIPLYSTVTGRREKGAHLNAEYWFQNARQPVLFTDALTAMLKNGFNTFLEIGPHPVLISGAKALIQQRNADAMITPSMTRREPEVTVFLQSIAQLAARGREPDVDTMFGSDRRYVRLPMNPWRHSRYWFESPSAAEVRRGQFEHPFLKRATQFATEAGQGVWDVSLDLNKFPYLRVHRVDDEIVFPATGHIELAWAVASAQFPQDSFFLEELQFNSALILPENAHHPLDVRLEVVSERGDYRVCSRPADATNDTPWSEHSSGRINTTHDHFEPSLISLDEIRQHFGDHDAMPVDRFYETIATAGLVYGETFRCIQELWHRDHEMLARVRLPDELMHEAQRNAVHPAVLDACLHTVFADVHRNGDPARIFLPYRVDRVRFYRRPTQTLWAHVRVSRNDEQFLCSDTAILDDAGELVAEFVGLTCKRLAGAGSHLEDTVYEGCYEYRWVAAPRDTDSHGHIYDVTRAVLVTSHQDEPLVSELATRLEAEGIQPTIIDSRRQKSLNELLADIPLDRRTLIVFVAASTANEAGSSNSDWPGLENCPSVPVLLELAQTVLKREGVPRLCVVTNGAAGQIAESQLNSMPAESCSTSNVNLGHATLVGMLRVFRNECTNVPVTTIDLSACTSHDEVDGLCEELVTCRRDRDESEVALRGTKRFVHKLTPVDRSSAEQASSTDEPGVGGAYRADISEPGLLDQIVFRRLPPADPGPEEVEIAVQAAGLNFKDIMNAMGMLSENAVSGGMSGNRLGLEAAGRVLRTGHLVDHVIPGDAVIARVADGFSGRVIAPASCVVRKPDRLTPQQAASVPAVYITAWYALYHLARLTRGETVLIHSAAGGVGGAAIQLAQRVGAKVIATAGTKEKREYLRKMGVEHVADSRSLDFYNHVTRATNGRGVDVVLNSLAGRFISQSLKCLAPFGRFVEIGKADIYRNSKLNLEQLGENISYFVVDVDRLAAQKPELNKQAFSEVIAMFERGELTPHEITEFPISRLGEAMKFMTRAAYRGKIVVNMQNDRVRTLPPHQATFRRDRTYLITGGASGFGLEIARWMVDRGARQLVLASRSGCKTDADRRVIEALTEQGVRVLLRQVDITDSEAVRCLLEQVSEQGPPMAGLIHGAAVLDDALVSTMDMTRFQRVFLPKAQGAWNLHEATLAMKGDLDFFVMLSSISSTFGVVGQVNYAAANCFQDSLAQYRCQLGLAGTSVNLGVLGDYAGMSNSENDDQDIIGLLESHGFLVMALSDVMAKLEAALVQSPAGRITARIDWARFRQAYLHLVRDSRFLHLMSDAALERGSRPSSPSLRQALAELEAGERGERMKHELVVSLARILDADPEHLDVSATLDHLGLDSLVLSQLRNWILRSLDVNLPMVKLLKGPSIVSLAEELLVQIDADSEADSGTTTETSTTATAFTLAEMEDIRVLNPWLIGGSSDPDAPLRLICFHSMGVGASLFTRFLLEPPAGYDIVAVQTPGRENRVEEPLVASMAELADQIVEQLPPLLDRPFVIWGHSFGGIVASEVLRRLRADYDRDPVHFLVTGTISPHRVHLWQKREVMLKAMVSENSPEYLISLSRYADDPEFLKAILPVMRRDWPLLKNHRFEPFTPMTHPITAFAARQDDMVYTDEIGEWAQHTRGGFELIEVDGDHWFLNRNRELIISTLQDIATGYHYNEAHPFVRSPTA